MKIEVVLTEAEVAQEFVESVQARDLPEKFFYWLPRSVRAWKSLAHDSGWTIDMNRAWKEVILRAAMFAPPGDDISIISYGAGDGLKDRALLRVLRDAGRQPRYIAVDGGQALLEMACAGAEDDDFDTLGIKADISSPPHLIFASDAAEGAKLFLLAGCTLGGFDPLSQIRYLAQSMGKGDRLVLDAEFHRPDTVSRRDHPAVREWLFAPLIALGIREEDGEIRFEEKRDERHAGLYMITRHFHAVRDLRTKVAGEDVAFQKAERIALNFQYVFSEEAFRWLLERHAGLKILEQFPSPEGRFTAVLCEKPA
jgi:uncharacterized SAM-dependent methyltransferase